MTAGLAIATRLLGRVPALRDDAPLAGFGSGSSLVPGGQADLVVIIPARNEAQVISGLLQDLLAQRTVASRVVVVEDCCSDDTVDVVARYASAPVGPRVELVRGRPTPPGWNPKTWAMHQGVQGVTERKLLFLDADVRLGPGAIEALLKLHVRCGGLLSVAPRHDVCRRHELLSLPFNLVAIMGAAAPADSATRGDGVVAARAAFGPCLLIDTEEYLLMGGHSAVRGELLDDVALAHHYRDRGGRLWLCRGGDLVRYRMYPDGARSLLEGWTKNIALGARRTPLAPALAISAWVMAMLTPMQLLTRSRDRRGGGLILASWAAVACHTVWSGRRVGRFGPLAALGSPLLAVVFVAITIRSAVLALFQRPVPWRGRVVRNGGGVERGRDEGRAHEHLG